MRFHRTAIVMVLAVLVFAGPQGCASIKEMTVGNGPAETVLQDPPSYGVISNVTPAAMLDKEIRRGDIAITVDLEDGRIVTVIQSEDNTYLVGDRVRVVRSGEKFSRVQLF